MRSIVLLLMFVGTCAYPDWFHEYKQKHRKLYEIQEEGEAFRILEQKYDFAKQHGYELTHRSDKNHSLGFNPFHGRRLSSHRWAYFNVFIGGDAL
jgi:hypothetical protein